MATEEDGEFSEHHRWDVKGLLCVWIFSAGHFPSSLGRTCGCPQATACSWKLRQEVRCAPNPRQHMSLLCSHVEHCWCELLAAALQAALHLFPHKGLKHNKGI